MRIVNVNIHASGDVLLIWCKTPQMIIRGTVQGYKGSRKLEPLLIIVQEQAEVQKTAVSERSLSVISAGYM